MLMLCGGAPPLVAQLELLHHSLAFGPVAVVLAQAFFQSVVLPRAAAVFDHLFNVERVGCFRTGGTFVKFRRACRQ